MPRQSQRQRSLDAARAQVADWEPVLDGQVDIFDVLDEHEIELAEEDPVLPV